MSDPRVVGVEDDEGSSLRLFGSSEAAAIWSKGKYNMLFPS